MDVSASQAVAKAVASDSLASYGVRVDAASLLSGNSISGLGSAELDLIASGAPTADAADKPYFYIARVKAAEKAAIPEAREHLLRNALNDAPERDSARVLIFHALVELGRDRIALSAISPVLRGNYFQGGQSRSSYSDASEETDESTESAGETPPDEPRPEGEVLQASTSDRVKLAEAVAGAYLQINDPQSALRYYRVAANLQKAGPERAAIDKSIAKVRAAIRRAANNERRSPTIHKELEQQHVVRPKLVVAMKSPPAPARKAKGGSAQ
jgi:hypothetical protein